VSRAPGDLLPNPRILGGAGPTTSRLDQFDPELTAVMNEVMELSCFAFQPGNRWTFPVTGTGRAGLEAAMSVA